MKVRNIVGGLTALLVGFGSVAAHAQTSNPGGPCYQEKSGEDITGYYRIAIGSVGRLVSPAETGRGDPNTTAYTVSGIYEKVSSRGAAPRVVSGSIQLQAGNGAQMGLFVYQNTADEPFSMGCSTFRASITPGKWDCLLRAQSGGAPVLITLNKVDPMLNPACKFNLSPG